MKMFGGEGDGMEVGGWVWVVGGVVCPSSARSILVRR